MGAGPSAVGCWETSLLPMTRTARCIPNGLREAWQDATWTMPGMPSRHQDRGPLAQSARSAIEQCHTNERQQAKKEKQKPRRSTGTWEVTGTLVHPPWTGTEE